MAGDRGVFALRCTRRLLDRMGVAPARDVVRSTTVLGDWYANLVYFERRQHILAVSERTLLPVLLPAANCKTVAARLPRAVAEVLAAFGIAAGAIEREVAEVENCTVSVTANRKVLGSMNDFARMLEFPPEHRETLISTAVSLSAAPCGPIGMESPRRTTVAAFATLLH